ncbi:2-keto-3-deoxy-galactonokinase [Gemmatirosa kalamazoonensis]|uniref:2-keto-3-deoxy-galactonokinase n=1 Tax=Gemmatirosa kalamazoonensis TaxID=861299 RepID=W0RQM1_9BACT|nr:2-dehydro-3-deoxygalactonokinase [Gemmatirosa kalamazoonensis]AHG91843.1 2-keto-3-deoxy-galactonokinase [Gemmatirosa kalamazoonensis]
MNPQESSPGPSSLIALDWGTTTLRAYLLDARGTVLATRAEPWGIMRLPAGGFAAAFDDVVSALGAVDLPAIACGMVGSAHGWIAAPYCPVPAGETELAAALAPVPDRRVHVVPGVERRGERPDLMRGEETQIVGALALHPELARRATFVLPGTHAKWARVVDGRVHDFATYMTGELFAVLRDHSILGRPARDTEAPSAAESADAFARGVRAATGAPSGLAPLLFSARAAVVTGAVAAAASLDHLSGLLLGDEIRSALATAGPPDALVGDPALCARYARALALLGHHDVPVIADAAPAGLWRIAVHAHIIPA